MDDTPDTPRMRHAPRGRIKAAADGDPSSPGPLIGRCTARSSRTGQPCKHYPIAGGTVCRTHGGAAPQVKGKAMERLMALQGIAITRLGQLALDTKFPSTSYAAVRDVLDRTMGKPHESVDVKADVTHRTIVHELAD